MSHIICKAKPCGFSIQLSQLFQLLCMMYDVINKPLFRRDNEGYTVDTQLKHTHAFTYVHIQYTMYVCAHLNISRNTGEMEEGKLKVHHSFSDFILTCAN